MINYSQVPQGTNEWLAERCGLITASNASKLRGNSHTRENYIFTLANQRDYGPIVIEPTFQSDAMRRGNELEPLARDAFELEAGQFFAEVGLATNSAYPGAGASLDGLSGDNGLEIKCPMAHTLQRYHHCRDATKQYVDQMVFQQLICELRLTHFYAWHPSMKPLHSIVPAENEQLAEMAQLIQRANNDIRKRQHRGTDAWLTI